MLKSKSMVLLAGLALGSSIFAVAAQDATPASTMAAAPDTITINAPGLRFDARRY